MLINFYLFFFSFQMSVEMFDYMDDILNLQQAGTSIYNSILIQFVMC